MSSTHSSLRFLIATCAFSNKFGANAHLKRQKRAEDGAPKSLELSKSWLPATVLQRWAIHSGDAKWLAATRK